VVRIFRVAAVARIGVMQALNRHIERVFKANPKEHHCGRRKLAWDRRLRPVQASLGQQRWLDRHRR